MPYRIYQGKEILAQGPIALRRGELYLELDTLELFVSDGSSTPIPVGNMGGGGTTSTFTGTIAFSQLTGQIGESQIAGGSIINTQLRTDNAATATWLLSANAQGGFSWVAPGGAGNANVSLAGQTGDYNDLTHKPVFTQGNLRNTNQVFSSPNLSTGSTYIISNLGNSDFTLAGASANQIGSVFVATTTTPGSGTAQLLQRFAVAITGNYQDLLDTPMLVSAFQNDANYVSTLTLASYVTTSQVNQIVGQQIDAAIATSGTFYTVVQELAALSTSTSVADALANRLRVDINTQNLTSQQKANAVTNLGLAPVAVTGDYNDLLNIPSTYAIQPATISTIGGVIIGSGLTVDHTGRIALAQSTATVNVNLTPPTSLKGQLLQAAGEIVADSNYVYLAQSDFNPTGIQTNQTASSATNIISVNSSQWLAAISNAQATYQPGQWHIYSSDKTQDYSVTAINQNNGIAYFTIDQLVNYTTAQQYWIQTTDTWKRIGEMDSYGTSQQSIGGVAPTTVTLSPTINLPQGQTYGTTATLLTLDCTGITYGEIAISFTDTNNTEYYKGTVEVFLYPDLSYTIHPNIAGSKTDRVVLGYSNGSAVYQNTAQIKIPVYNGDRNVGLNQTQSTIAISQVNYTWLVRVNI